MRYCRDMSYKPIVCGIVAVGPNNIIGHNGGMPWHSRQDFYHFKNTTMGYPCIFGKNTYDSLPKKPLLGRLNIICSSSYKTEQKGDVVRVPSLAEAFAQCGNVSRVFICGGAMLYDYALDKDLIDVMYLTRIQLMDEILKDKIFGDKNNNVYFNHDFDASKWQESEIVYAKGILPIENPGVKAAFYKYVRLR